jgi:hypothetical protein
MRLIGSLQGYAAFREVVEEYQPERGIVQNDMIALIVERYQFQGFPRLAPGAPPLPSLVFGAGKFESGEQSFAIAQLAMFAHGDVAITVTTDQAELVLNDLIQLLDKELGFRLGSANKKKRFLSNIVVEFDAGLEIYLDKLIKMEAAIAAAGLENAKLKRLAFGEGDVQQTNDVIVMIETADFLIERRQGAAYDQNRYFCSAPMSTSDHFRVLQLIESIARGDKN